MSGPISSKVRNIYETRNLWKRKTTKEFEDLRQKLRKKQRQSLKSLKQVLVPKLTRYPKQHMAVTAADTYNSSCDGDKTKSFCTSHHRLFSLELSNTGKRTFFSCSALKFWKIYMNTSPNQRHYYEIIRERFPCRLYFDCEFYKEFNPTLDIQVDGGRMVPM